MEMERIIRTHTIHMCHHMLYRIQPMHQPFMSDTLLLLALTNDERWTTNHLPESTKLPHPKSKVPSILPIPMILIYKIIAQIPSIKPKIHRFVTKKPLL